MPFLLPLCGLAAAAPWPVDLPQHLAAPPAQMAVYAVVPVDPTEALQRAQDVLGLAGQPTWSARHGGNLRVTDSGQFAWAFSDGGLDYFDDARFTSEAPIYPRESDVLWAEADALMENLGRFDISGFDVTPGNVGRAEASILDAEGRNHGPWVTGQSVAYRYTLEGYDVFGSGSETSFDFDGDGIVAFFDAQRELELSEVVAPDGPRRALRRWMDRADQEGRWSMYRAYIHDIERVRIDRVELGYYAASIGADAPTIEPVYQITGVMLGHDEDGRPVAVDLIWWEPAVAGRSIPELHLPSNR